MSSAVDIPLQLALALVLANGAPLPERIDRRVLEPHAGITIRARRVDFGYDEQRWLGAVLRHGRAAGLDDLAARVFRTGSGRIYAPVEADRQAILALLAEPAVVARVAMAGARADGDHLAVLLARDPTPAELYVAHLLGIEAAATLLQLADEPSRPAAEALPQAALAHPALFFRGTRPRTVPEILREIELALARTLPGSK